jgi:hypothetical protein
MCRLLRGLSAWMADVSTFRSEAVRVLVPASSANLGPGFDSAGLALALEDELIAVVTSAYCALTYLALMFGEEFFKCFRWSL